MSTDSAYFLKHQLSYLPSANVNWFSLPFLEHWLFQLPSAHVNCFGIFFGHQQFWVIYCVCINSSGQYFTHIILSVYLMSYTILILCNMPIVTVSSLTALHKLFFFNRFLRMTKEHFSLLGFEFQPQIFFWFLRNSFSTSTFRIFFLGIIFFICQE